MFIVVAGIAIVVGLLFALVPMFGRTRLPWPLMAGIAVGVPAATVVLYLAYGTPDALEPSDPRAHELRQQMISIARTLERNPDQGEQWQRLGLMYKDLRQHSSAEHALRRALDLKPDSAFVRVELAEAIHRRSELPEMPLEARLLLTEALEINPEQIKALWLLGMDDFVGGDYARALAHWEQMLPLVPEDSSIHRAVRNETQRAQRLLEIQR